jgi:hypothetical protein
MMKKHDFRYIFYGYKIILIALFIIGFIYGSVWLFLHFHRFAVGFTMIFGLVSISAFAWVIGENKYSGEKN